MLLRGPWSLHADWLVAGRASVEALVPAWAASGVINIPATIALDKIDLIAMIGLPIEVLIRILRSINSNSIDSLNRSCNGKGECVKFGLFRTGIVSLFSFCLALPGASSGADSRERAEAYLLRVARIDWRIRRAALKDCPVSAMRPAFVLDARSAYRAGKEARLPDLPWVIGFTDMAAAGGALVPGDEIRAIERIPVSQLMQGVDGQILPEHILAHVDHMVPQASYRLEVQRAGHARSVDVPARALCPGLTIVRQGRRGDAFSDLHNVAITTGLLDKLGSDDAVAFIIGHELAHTIFADSRKGPLSRRDKESRADLYGAHIAACAGFDPGKAIEALAVVRSMNVGGLSLTHRPYKVRQQAIARYLSVRPDCQAAFTWRSGEK